MIHAEIIEAIANLAPNAEWTLAGDDYSKIEWLSKNIAKPTLEDIELEVTMLPIRKAEKEAANIKAKADLLEKLGITEDEAKLLLS